MKRKKFFNYLCSGLIGLAACLRADAQSMEAFSFNTTLTPSVESFAISKFGKLSPSLYTGAMSYSLPLYTYKDEDFTIPISLDYSFSGYRPSQHSGTVGYGWALNCGGVITREVIGLPDDARPGDQDGAGYAIGVDNQIYAGNPQIHSGKQFYLEHFVPESALSSINLFSDRPLYQGYDTCPDIFRFSFLDYTGEFMLTPNGEIKVFNSSHPSGEFSITYEFGFPTPSDTLKSEIVIKTGNGYSYHFGGGHKSLEFSKSSESNDTQFTITAWKLNKIIAPNGNDVEFVYSDFQKDFSIFESYTPEIDADIVAVGAIMGGYSSSQTLQYTNGSFYHLLSGIKINDKNVISFAYDSKENKENVNSCFQRTLSPNSFGSYNYAADEKKLSSVKVVNALGECVDEFVLEHESKGGGAPRTFLKSVSSLRDGKHSFVYDLSKSLPKNDTYGTDHWGYWNGKDTMSSLKNYIMNPTLLDPLRDLYHQLTNESVKAANFSFSKIGALTKIIYPTGGETRIVYEPHEVEELTNGGYDSFIDNEDYFVPGGARVSQTVAVSDEINETICYHYDGGVLMHMPRYAAHMNYKYISRVVDPIGGSTQNPASITAIAYTDDCSMSALRDPHVVYSKVTIENPDGSTSVSDFFCINDYYDMKKYMDDYIMVCSDIEVIAKGHQNNLDDMVYYDGDPSFIRDVRNAFLPYTDDFSRIRSKLKSLKEYDANGNLISGVEYHYGTALPPVHTQYMVYNALLDFIKAPLRIYAPKLQRETRYAAYENGLATEVIEFTYNDLGQTKSISHYRGDKYSIKEYKYYGEQFPSYEGDHLKTAVVAEADVTEGSDNQRYIRSIVRYHYDDTSNPHPTKIDIYTSDTPALVSTDCFAVPAGYTLRTVEYAYDSMNGRLIEEFLPGGRYSCFEWDENGKNIKSIMINGSINKTTYTWKDMVGLKSVAYPTLQSKLYQYDNKNRLQTTSDTDGNCEINYRYNLKNE